MRNFGRLLLDADRVIRDGTAAPANTRETDLVAAHNGVLLALSCADAVLADTTGALEPSVSQELQGAEREADMKEYIAQMRELADVLSAYGEMFKSPIGKTPTAQDFEVLTVKRKAVLDKAAEAHKLLQ